MSWLQMDEGEEIEVDIDREDADLSVSGRSINSEISGKESPKKEGYPKSQVRVLKALKKLQFDSTKLEAQFYEEVHQLECKYSALYAPLYKKREDIITGKVVPTDEDCECSFDADITIVEDSEEGDDNDNANSSEEVTGLPGFWLRALKNVDMINDKIQPGDEPILEYLSDIKVTMFGNNPMGFTLAFLFHQNEYFENAILEKTYEMKCIVDDEDPFSFEGPEIFKCSGCEIAWKPGMDVTEKRVIRKQKHRSSGTVREVSSTIHCDSFFNFFKTCEFGNEACSAVVDPALRDFLTADFEIGHFLRERFIPRAILFYTGEAIDMDDMFGDGEDEFSPNDKVNLEENAELE